MNEDVKTIENEVTATDETPAPAVEQPKKSGSRTTKKTEVVIASLNDWEKRPTASGIPKEVVEHANGITAYHY